MQWLRQLGVFVWAGLAIPAVGMGGERPQSLARFAAATIQTQPAISILAAPSGAMLQSVNAGNASLSFGRAAYYGGNPTPGVTLGRSSSSMVLATHFALKVDCGSAQSLADVAISLSNGDSSYSVRVDGVTL